jgi:phosphatidylglycerophosphate synthase
MMMTMVEDSWKTKPSDRFVLRWIKLHLAARITPHLAGFAWLEPWMVTLCSASLGVVAGVFFACGWGFLAGLTAAVAQVLDGVDGQLARLTDRQNAAGAFLDSVLDRYTDGFLVIGIIVYVYRLPVTVASWLLLVLGSLAFIGSNLVSYSSARAETLGIALGGPTLASKGTRTSLMVLCGLGSPVWPPMPLVALCYLAIHPNLVVAARLARAFR